MEGEDTVAFLDHQAPLLFRCSRQVPLMSASFGEVGGKGFMRVAWEWRREIKVCGWCPRQRGGEESFRIARQRVSNLYLPLVLLHCALSLSESQHERDHHKQLAEVW